MRIDRVFNGKLNLDTQNFRIPQGDFVDAMNVTRDSPGSAQDIVVANLQGNELVDYTLPSGINKVIGQFADRVRNRVYYFVWNSNNYDLILYYDKNNDTIVKLVENLTDTDGDVLDFDPSYHINHVDVEYNDIYGDLLFWTDGQVSPRKLNVQHIENGVYSTIKRTFIEVAKAPPLSPPTCQYGSDATRNSNSLRRTLFMFSSRFQYDDFEKSSFSQYSTIPLPVGFYGSDNDIDNTKNNFITVTVETGDENVSSIEIAMRYNINNAWSDFVLVVSLNKSQLGIANNSTYQFLFYNDEIYPTIQDGVQYVDGVQVLPLFFWVPQTAYTQALANGNVPVYGAITEGYDNYPVNELQVTITAENKTNVPPDADPPSITYEALGISPSDPGELRFQITGTVTEGNIYTVIITSLDPDGNPISFTITYTAQSGDDIAAVATGMVNYAVATYPIFPYEWVDYGGGLWGAFPIYNPYTVTINVVPATPSGDTISTEKTWMNNCPYAFGLVYFDEQGRDMPGVTTFANPIDSDNDFLLTTPSFSEDTGERQTPVVSASINHLPPTGAVKYAWVRKRLQYTNWLEYETCDFQDPSDGYYYFCLNNIEAYKEANTQFIYGSAPISGGNNRIKIIAEIDGTDYVGQSSWGQDYQVLGTVTRTLTGGSSPDDDRVFIKVKAPTTPPSTAYLSNMLVMVYTPFSNPTGANSVYYEWGQSYDIYEDGGVMYHRGLDQDQTGSQPATFTWPEGDVYYHTRDMYSEILTDPYATDTVSVMDESFSDFFNSAVNDNGRAQAIEVNARRIYNPVLYRFGGAYQNGTSINKNPDFFFENFNEADRGGADIRKMYIWKRYLYVFQKLKTGVIPILTQIVRDTQGNPLEANSDILLNKINYPYRDDLGIGDIPESFAADEGAMYGCSDYRGVVWRLSQDGFTILSIVFECNSFFAQKLPFYRKSLNNGYAASGETYTGDPTVFGGFNRFTNKYVIALEEINRYDSDGNLIYHQDPKTISFNEVRNPMEGFESFYGYFPEMLSCLDIQFFAFKDGQLWKFTNEAPRCNFFGGQQDCSITGVFNDNAGFKKTFQALSEIANDVWECPQIETNVPSYGTTMQSSKLLPQNFKVLEGMPSSALYRDINSRGGWINGGFLKGQYIVIKFLKQNASSLIYLNGASVYYKESNLNNVN